LSYALFEEAEQQLLKVYATRLTQFESEHDLVAKTVNFLIHLYEQWGKPEEAAKWKATLPLANKADEKQVPVPVP
ncbi:MAG: hypothetical protein VX913_15330, partial [Planctomycetota bacterium]|nr:hypothetical protein [Planctomycetota bacterium]